MSTVKVDNLQARSDDVLTIPSSLNVTGYSANVSGNVSVARSLAVGYTDGRTPQANLEVKVILILLERLVYKIVVNSFICVLIVQVIMDG